MALGVAKRLAEKPYTDEFRVKKINKSIYKSVIKSATSCAVEMRLSNNRSPQAEIVVRFEAHRNG